MYTKYRKRIRITINLPASLYAGNLVGNEISSKIQKCKPGKIRFYYFTTKIKQSTRPSSIYETFEGPSMSTYRLHVAYWRDIWAVL